jgi:hypothetical protein
MQHWIESETVVKTQRGLTWAAIAISILTLIIVLALMGRVGRVQQGVVDQCNIISNILDDQALRVYCTQLYQSEAK